MPALATTKMIIKNNGNVGIGTISPASKFTILGQVTDTESNFGANDYAQLVIHDADAASALRIGYRYQGGVAEYGRIQAQSGAYGVPLILNPNGGSVGIGLTNPTYQLQLSANSAAKPTSNVWTVASDGRIKKNIADFTDGLDVIMKLNPRVYQYNGLGGPGYDDAGAHIGFVAQEVEPIASYMIETGQGIIGGKPVDDFKSYQGHALQFILINAIQEQQKEIDELKEQIKNLNEKVNNK